MALDLDPEARESTIPENRSLWLGTVRTSAAKRQIGPNGVHAPRNTGDAAVLTAPVLAEAQRLLAEGREP